MRKRNSVFILSIVITIVSLLLFLVWRFPFLLLLFLFPPIICQRDRQEDEIIQIPVCPNCGKRLVELNENFCPRCGYKIAQEIND